MPQPAKWPNRPISANRLHTALRDRYYLGVVQYDGIWYTGRHEPLVTAEVFDRVQRVLDSPQGAGTREREHHHYLKGLLYCGRCRKRFVVQPAKGNGGVYYYFFCRGRKEDGCDQPYV